MPSESKGNETPVSSAARRASRSAQTEAIFFEDADKIIAEAASGTNGEACGKRPDSLIKTSPKPALNCRLVCAERNHNRYCRLFNIKCRK
jgi:hypothetical protein